MTIDYVKQTLDLFFAASQPDTRTVKIDKGGPDSQINRTVYELENYLYELKKKNKLNLTLNADIALEKIRQSFDTRSPRAYSKADYEYNFLLFLAYNYKPEQEVRHYIHDFTQVFKEHMTWMDLVITETRATRSFTNIRFAISSLRKQGLLHQSSDDNDGLHPTLGGLLVLLYVKRCMNFDTVSGGGYPFIAKSDMMSSAINQPLYQGTRHLSKPENAIKFCEELIEAYGDSLSVLYLLYNELTKERERLIVDIMALSKAVERIALQERKHTRVELMHPFVNILKAA